MKRTIRSAQVAAFRMLRHHLADASGSDVVTGCRDICGVQAQVASAAEMALWARIDGLDCDDIDRALWRDRTLVKSNFMRLTLHWVPSDEHAMYATALRDGQRATHMRIFAKLGTTTKDAEQLNAAILDLLRDGAMTKGELTSALQSRVSKPVRAWIDKVWNPMRLAIIEGLVCYGPPRGPETTMVRTDQWLPKQRRITKEAAQAELLRHFLRAYGPADVSDFRFWSGLPMAEARAAWSAQRDAFCEVTLEDRSAFVLAEDQDALADAHLPGQVVRLLPNFDPYLLAHAEKDHLVERAHYKKIYRNQGWISPVVLVNGKVAATWSLQRGKKNAIINVAPFTKLAKSVRDALAAEAASLGKFLAVHCDVSYA